ncbi:hypothetical protein CC85DRAFT_239208, partial [Cutaneotrichosporon oleaginosum]
EPTRLQWSGGSPPYWVTVIPAGQPSAAPIMTLADSSDATSMTWNVNLPANSQITLQIRDGTGNVQYSSPITVQAGSNTACLTASASGTDSAGAVAGASGAPTNNAPSGSASASPSAAGSPSAAAAASVSSAASAATSAAATPTPGAASAVNIPIIGAAAVAAAVMAYV